VTTDGDETTSHYVISHFGDQKAQALVAPALGKDAPVLSGPEELKALAARIHGAPDCRQHPDCGVLVMVRNNQVEELNRLVSGLEPLWSFWQCSLWGVSGASGKSRLELPRPTLGRAQAPSF